MPKDSIQSDKTGATDFTGNISRTLNDAMVTSMAECFAIQQGIMNVPIFNGKNMPVRDFIQDVINGEASIPANCEKQYIRAVLSRLKGAARDSTHGKSFFSMKDLIDHLKQRFAPHKSYTWYTHEISNIKMTRNESVSEYYDRLTLLKSGAQAALEDRYDNADLLLAPLNDCALESFIRGLPDGLSGAVESRNPNSMEAALKYAIEYESRHQLNPQSPHNNFYDRNFAQPAYSGMRDRSPSPHIRFAAPPERNRPNE